MWKWRCTYFEYDCLFLWERCLAYQYNPFLSPDILPFRYYPVWWKAYLLILLYHFSPWHWTSKLQWPLQQCPGTAEWTVWHNFVKKWFSHNDYCFCVPLGNWIPKVSSAKEWYTVIYPTISITYIFTSWWKAYSISYITHWQQLSFWLLELSRITPPSSENKIYKPSLYYLVCANNFY